MKKVMKYLTLIVLCLSLTGCMKYNINITVNADKTMEASMVIKVQNSFLEAYGSTADEFFESIEEE
ncbi:MAG: hypothetical protein LUF02_11395 [Erysipelotrichaceae bacterium]|nr:hypothetical protein [Erysipelotrichaceae bacterium]